MGKKILITGGTGLIGSVLSELLIEKGYTVAVLSRSKEIKGTKSFYWDYESKILDEEAIEFADIIIHLAGEDISKSRWSKKQKQKIVDSRVQTTNLLFEKASKAKKKPQLIISASAVGYYGMTTSEHIFKEEDKPGNDFLANTVISWEQSVDQFNQLGIRTVKLRLGVVFSKKGGALAKMIMPVKLGLGSALGSGKQYVPWIEISDLTQMFLFVVENEKAETVYNAVAPDYITNHELIKSLAEALGKPFFVPKVPAFILKLIFGSMADVFLQGSKVSSEKIQSMGFKFNCTSVPKLPL